MQAEYVIIQAGGKGTRLQHLTKNKPKALVSIKNLPMIFHAFKKFEGAKFIIIGDYHYDVLNRYLKAFCPVEYVLVDARGKQGTCAGLNDAIKLIPENKSFVIMWSDLILSPDFDITSLKEANYVGIAENFVCRWSFEVKNGASRFIETPSSENGVAGFFIFKDKQQLKKLDDEGEFVGWLSCQNIDFKPLSLAGTNEYGLLSVVNSLEPMRCRPFNRLIIENNTITKEGIDQQGLTLAKREQAWYKFVINEKFSNLPKIYSLNPLKMQLVHGNNIYTYTTLTFQQKTKILIQIVNCLKKLHKIGSVPSNKESFDDAYIDKTLKRLEKVKQLVPFANDEYITINQQKCKNVFYALDELKQKIEKYFPKEFVFIHGDCTFSNILLDDDGTPILIDPRGYFGKTDFYGDVAYDWAKLYYSILGNYDQFNLKNFRLSIEENQVKLKIGSSHWEDMAEIFCELVSEDVCKQQLDLIHAIIWLSLTTYAWDDYDSICGAFYNGVLLLNKCL